MLPGPTDADGTGFQLCYAVSGQGVPGGSRRAAFYNDGRRQTHPARAMGQGRVFRALPLHLAERGTAGRTTTARLP